MWSCSPTEFLGYVEVSVLPTKSSMYHVHPLLLDGLFLVAQAGASVQLSGFVVQAVERVVRGVARGGATPLYYTLVLRHGATPFRTQRTC